MKTRLKNSLLFPILLVGIGSALLGQAQTFTTLHSFTGGSDGAYPYAGLITNPSANTLYGTTSHGGSFTSGTIFKLSNDGTDFTTLYSFSPITIANSDGA